MNKQSFITITSILFLFAILSCQSTSYVSKYDCSNSNGQQVISSTQAIEVASNYLEKKGVVKYWKDSCIVTEPDSISYLVMFKKLEPIMPPNEIVSVRKSDGCAEIYIQE